MSSEIKRQRVGAASAPSTPSELMQRMQSHSGEPRQKAMDEAAAAWRLDPPNVALCEAMVMATSFADKTTAPRFAPCVDGLVAVAVAKQDGRTAEAALQALTNLFEEGVVVDGPTATALTAAALRIYETAGVSMIGCFACLPPTEAVIDVLAKHVDSRVGRIALQSAMAKLTPAQLDAMPLVAFAIGATMHSGHPMDAAYMMTLVGSFDRIPIPHERMCEICALCPFSVTGNTHILARVIRRLATGAHAETLRRAAPRHQSFLVALASWATSDDDAASADAIAALQALRPKPKAA